jgi:hypothetical protein
MISALRQELFRELERLSEAAPDLRFGQMVANLTFLAAGPWDQMLWNVEDEQLLVALRMHLEDLRNRRPDVGGSPETSAPGQPFSCPTSKPPSST